MRLVFLCFALSFMMLVVGAYGQFNSLDTDVESVTFSVSGQNSNSSTAVTAAVPLRSIGGYGAIFVSRQTAEDKIVSEVATGRVQGGYRFIDGYIELERDLHRGIELESEIGYFLVPGTARFGAFSVTVGAGNYSANTTVKEALGIRTSDAVSFGWTAFATIDFWQTSTTVTAEPDIGFEEVQVEAESTIRHSVADNFEVGVTVKGLFDSDPIIAGRLHSQYLLFARWTR